MSGRRTGVKLAGGLVAVSVLFASVALAASLSITSKKLATGHATVSRCATNGVSVTQNLTSSNVTSVTIAGIASTCVGGALSVTVNNGTANSSGTGTVPSGGSMTVNLAPAVPANDTEEIDVSISGP